MHHIKRPRIVRKFYIIQNMLPSIISRDTASAILFIGRMVWILKNPPEETTSIQDNIWNGKELEYYQKIQNLEKEPFSLQKFNARLEECKLKLSDSLRTIMIEEAQLMEHFQLIRDYYGLGRGELFQQFIVDAAEYFEKPITDNILAVLNVTLNETAIGLYTEKDQSYNRFELTLSNGSNSWTSLHLNFDITWPLHIFFHPKAIEIYNQLFCYLLRLKRTGVFLNQLWLCHIKEKTDMYLLIYFLQNFALIHKILATNNC